MRLATLLTGFAALSAIAGGAELVLWPNGNAFVHIDLLDATTFRTFLIPGLLLAGVVGGLNAVASVLCWRRSRAAPDVLLLAGGALAIWIVVEVALLREFHWLHALYGGLGLWLSGLGVAAVARSGESRHHWLLAVTAAVAIWLLAPVTVGLALVHRGVDPGVAPLLMAGGNLIGLVGLYEVDLARRDEPVSLSRWFGWASLAWALAVPVSVATTPLIGEGTPLAGIAVVWICAGVLMAYVMAAVTWQGVRRVT